MKFGKFIMDSEHNSRVANNTTQDSKEYRDNVKLNRRNVNLYDNGGLAAFMDKFTVGKNVKSVKLTATALGVFEVYVNGKRVGDDELKPGWTDYRRRVFEFEYDITSLCKTNGQNCIVACVAPGWYSGNISYSIYGNKPCAFCAEITVIDKNDHVIVFATDESWETAFGGRTRTGEIWDGELYDAREKSIYASPDSYKWRHAVLCDDVTCTVVPHVGETIKLKRKGIAPISSVVYDKINENGTSFGEINVVSKKVGNNCECGIVKKGQKMVLDFGTDFAARPRFKLKADFGTRVKVFCGEMLNDSGMKERGNDGAKGSVYMQNYRTALSRIEYISNGEEEEYTPLYTFFGYRYLEIVPDGDIEIVYVCSDVIGTDLKRTGKIETSNAEVNKFIDNVYRGLESNYLSVPTDCPQRDERLGWTGDTQIFCGAAAYFVNAYAFLSKWMGDMRDSRSSDGIFPFIAPTVFPESDKFGSCAWSDAGIIVPYKMWLMYGDKTILEENFDAMELYIVRLYEKYGLNGPTPVFGDWLGYEKTPKDYVSVCYFIYDAILMEKICKVLDKNDRAEYYASLKCDITEHYKKLFVENGEFKVKTQTGYLLALAFDVLDGELYLKACDELKAKISDNDHTLTTGFVGTGCINQTLSKVGFNDEAYSLLLQTKDPSWLYSVRQGATTVWERWNSYTIDKGFGDVGMNSFNHYAYGAVVEWLFAYVAGIRPIEEYPGFKKFMLAPMPDTRKQIPKEQERITSVKAEFESVCGLIKAAWHYENGRFVYQVTVPSETTAVVEFPILTDKKVISINDVEFSEGENFKIINGKMVFELKGGEYVIT